MGVVVKLSQKKIMIFGGSALIVILAALAGVFFWKYHNLKQDPQTVAKETSERVIGEVSKLYKLPTKETPTVARVEDKQKLSGQEFFKSAQDGDYILIYTSSKLAVLYRESANQLINVGPINLTDQSSKPTVGVLNGSGGTDRLKALETQLQPVASQIRILGAATDAVNKATPITLVIDVSGKNAALVESIAKQIKGQVAASMPAGEAAPSGAEIVIIAGKN